MDLRSRRIPASSPKDPESPTTPRQRPRPKRAPPSAKSGREPVRALAVRERTVSECSSHDSEVVIHSSPKSPFMQTRRKRRALIMDDSEDFKTPVRRRQLRVRYQMDIDSPKNAAVRNIYSPIVRFLSPEQSDKRTPRPDAVSPIQCVIEYSCVMVEDEEEEVFNPYDFIKNIPSQSQQSKSRTRDIPVKTRSAPEATLVLDLDETLVYSSLKEIEDAEHTFSTRFQDQEYKVFLKVRPHAREFLESMAKRFEIFIYTSAKKAYAEKILDILDPQRKIIRHRLYQDDCFCISGHYIKDLTVLKRDLAKTVIVDNTPHVVPYHLMNMIPIQSWFGNRDDRELLTLIPYLEKLSDAKDFRQVLKRRTDHLHRLLSKDGSLFPIDGLRDASLILASCVASPHEISYSIKVLDIATVVL
ncbi:CTD small phosphatase-like protein 3 isoform X1 [Amia ocellicauda]|uniref:CTD small phosphatase-like protein 3 isoform X1 n=1 Tax=Amia ocellicauda TaxID=2972642 RepID=UPI003463F82F